MFRIVFGLVCLAGVVRSFAYGWVSELYVEPAHHFTYLGFGWVTPWPGWGMHLHFALLGVLALGIAIGYRYRVCALAFFLGFTYVELLDKTNYLNHYYLVSLISLLMVFIPLNRSMSVDRRLAERGGDGPAGREWDAVPAVTLWVLRGQVAVVYLFAGIAKLNPDWLLEAQPLRIWLHHHTDLPLVGPLMGDLWIAYAMSWAGAFFDLTIVGWLLWRRTRVWALLMTVVFHLSTWFLFPQIGVFPWLMLAGALVFFPPDWPKRLAGNLRATGKSGSPDTVPAPDRSIAGKRRAWLPKVVCAAIAVYFLVQLAVPLRHYAYPGNVRWNEEGYRFSWRVLLTEKAGMAEYRVVDPESGRSWRVGPERYLTPLQPERGCQTGRHQIRSPLPDHERPAHPVGGRAAEAARGAVPADGGGIGCAGRGEGDGLEEGRAAGRGGARRRRAAQRQQAWWRHPPHRRSGALGCRGGVSLPRGLRQPGPSVGDPPGGR